MTNMNTNQQLYTSEAIFNIPEINEIIMGYKKQIDLVHDKKSLKEWINHKRELERELEEATRNISHLRKRVKKNCDHTDVTECIKDGWERSIYTYTCNKCDSNVTLHHDFNYKCITNTYDNRC